MAKYFRVLLFLVFVADGVSAQNFVRAGGNPVENVIISVISENSITVGMTAKEGTTYPVHPDLLSTDVPLIGYYRLRLSEVRVGMKVTIEIQRQHCVGIGIGPR